MVWSSGAGVVGASQEEEEGGPAGEAPLCSPLN